MSDFGYISDVKSTSLGTHLKHVAVMILDIAQITKL